MKEKLRNEFKNLLGRQLKFTFDNKNEVIGSLLEVKEETIVICELGKKDTYELKPEQIRHIEEYHYKPKEIYLAPNEVDFKGLKDADRFQLLVRYLNDFATYLKNITSFTAETYLLTKFICEKQGIDFEKMKKDLASKTLKDLDEKENKIKEEIKKTKVES